MAGSVWKVIILARMHCIHSVHYTHAWQWRGKLQVFCVQSSDDGARCVAARRWSKKLWTMPGQVEPRLSSLIACRRSSMPISFCTSTEDACWNAERTASWWLSRSTTTDCTRPISAIRAPLRAADQAARLDNMHVIYSVHWWRQGELQSLDIRD